MEEELRRNFYESRRFAEIMIDLGYTEAEIDEDGEDLLETSHEQDLIQQACMDHRVDHPDVKFGCVDGNSTVRSTIKDD